MNVYIWNDTWLPNKNTIAYYPLTSTSTVNDLSWNNRNLTNSWVTFQTYSWVNCAYLNGTSAQLSYSNFYNIAQWDYTINVWARRLHTWLSAWNDWYVMCIGSTSSYYKWQTSLIEFDDTRLRFAFWYDDLDSSINPEDTRTNICCQFKKTTNQQFIYVNWSFNNSRTATNTHILQVLNLVIWNRYNTDPNYNNHFKWYLSNLIFENKQWTADQVAWYYNQTKSLYWIS